MGPIKDDSRASCLCVSITGSVPLCVGAGEEARKKIFIWALVSDSPQHTPTVSAVAACL